MNLKKFNKVVSAFLILCFPFNEILHAAPEVSLRSFRISPEITSARFSSEFPHELGKIDHVHFPSSKKDSIKVIHIKTAHGIYSGAKQVEKIITFLSEKYGINSLYVEGASESLRPELMRFFKSEKMNLELAERLARDGWLTGVELGILQSKNREMKSFGVEDAALYRRSYQKFRSVLKQSDFIEKELEKKKRELDRSSVKLFDSKTRRQIQNWIRFEKHEMSLMSFMNELEGSARRRLKIDFNNPFHQFAWPQLVRFSLLRQLEKQMDLPELEKELKVVTSELDKKNKAILNALQNPNLQNPRGFYEDFFATNDFVFRDYPQLIYKAAYQVIQSEINAEPLFNEIRRLLKKLIESGSKSSDQKKLLEKYEKWLLFSKLGRLELTREEWGSLSRKNIGSAAWMRSAVEFYRLAEEREEVFLNKLIENSDKHENKPVLLVTGGFHTDGMKSLFEKSAISYALLTPRLESVEENTYHQIMLGRAHLDKVPFLLSASVGRKQGWNYRSEVRAVWTHYRGSTPNLNSSQREAEWQKSFYVHDRRQYLEGSASPSRSEIRAENSPSHRPSHSHHHPHLKEGEKPPSWALALALTVLTAYFLYSFTGNSAVLHADKWHKVLDAILIGGGWFAGFGDRGEKDEDEKSLKIPILTILASLGIILMMISEAFFHSHHNHHEHHDHHGHEHHHDHFTEPKLSLWQTFAAYGGASLIVYGIVGLLLNWNRVIHYLKRLISLFENSKSTADAAPKLTAYFRLLNLHVVMDLMFALLASMNGLLATLGFSGLDYWAGKAMLIYVSFIAAMIFFGNLKNIFVKNNSDAPIPNVLKPSTAETLSKRSEVRAEDKKNELSRRTLLKWVGVGAVAGTFYGVEKIVGEGYFKNLIFNESAAEHQKIESLKRGDIKDNDEPVGGFEEDFPEDEVRVLPNGETAQAMRLTRIEWKAMNDMAKSGRIIYANPLNSKDAAKIPGLENFTKKIHEPDVLASFVKALGISSNPNVLPLLQEIARNEQDETVRMYTAWALGRFLSTQNNLGKIDDARFPLLQRFSLSPERFQKLSEEEKAEFASRGITQPEENFYVRANAARSLFSLMNSDGARDDRALNELRELLQDSEVYVVLAAIEAIAQTGNARFFQPLLDLLDKNLHFVPNRHQINLGDTATMNLFFPIHAIMKAAPDALYAILQKNSTLKVLRSKLENKRLQYVDEKTKTGLHYVKVVLEPLLEGKRPYPKDSLLGFIGAGIVAHWLYDGAHAFHHMLGHGSHIYDSRNKKITEEIISVRERNKKMLQGANNDKAINNFFVVSILTAAWAFAQVFYWNFGSPIIRAEGYHQGLHVLVIAIYAIVQLVKYALNSMASTGKLRKDKLEKQLGVADAGAIWKALLERKYIEQETIQIKVIPRKLLIFKGGEAELESITVGVLTEKALSLKNPQDLELPENLESEYKKIFKVLQNSGDSQPDLWGAIIGGILLFGLAGLMIWEGLSALVLSAYEPAALFQISVEEFINLILALWLIKASSRLRNGTNEDNFKKHNLTDLADTGAFIIGIVCYWFAAPCWLVGPYLVLRIGMHFLGDSKSGTQQAVKLLKEHYDKKAIKDKSKIKHSHDEHSHDCGHSGCGGHHDHSPTVVSIAPLKTSRGDSSKTSIASQAAGAEAVPKGRDAYGKLKLFAKFFAFTGIAAFLAISDQRQGKPVLFPAKQLSSKTSPEKIDPVIALDKTIPDLPRELLLYAQAARAEELEKISPTLKREIAALMPKFATYDAELKSIEVGISKLQTEITEMRGTKIHLENELKTLLPKLKEAGSSYERAQRAGQTVTQQEFQQRRATYESLAARKKQNEGQIDFIPVHIGEKEKEIAKQQDKYNVIAHQRKAALELERTQIYLNYVNGHNPASDNDVDFTVLMGLYIYAAENYPQHAYRHLINKLENLHAQFLPKRWVDESQNERYRQTAEVLIYAIHTAAVRSRYDVKTLLQPFRDIEKRERGKISASYPYLQRLAGELLGYELDFQYKPFPVDERAESAPSLTGRSEVRRRGNSNSEKLYSFSILEKIQLLAAARSEIRQAKKFTPEGEGLEPIILLRAGAMPAIGALISQATPTTPRVEYPTVEDEDSTSLSYRANGADAQLKIDRDPQHRIVLIEQTYEEEGKEIIETTTFTYSDDDRLSSKTFIRREAGKTTYSEVIPKGKFLYNDKGQLVGFKSVREVGGKVFFGLGTYTLDDQSKPTKLEIRVEDFQSKLSLETWHYEYESNSQAVLSATQKIYTQDPEKISLLRLSGAEKTVEILDFKYHPVEVPIRKANSVTRNDTPRFSSVPLGSEGHVHYDEALPTYDFIIRPKALKDDPVSPKLMLDTAAVDQVLQEESAFSLTPLPILGDPQANTSEPGDSDNSGATEAPLESSIDYPYGLNPDGKSPKAEEQPMVDAHPNVETEKLAPVVPTPVSEFVIPTEWLPIDDTQPTVSTEQETSLKTVNERPEWVKSWAWLPAVVFVPAAVFSILKASKKNGVSPYWRLLSVFTAVFLLFVPYGWFSHKHPFVRAVETSSTPLEKELDAKSFVWENRFLTQFEGDPSKLLAEISQHFGVMIAAQDDPSYDQVVIEVSGYNNEGVSKLSAFIEISKTKDAKWMLLVWDTDRELLKDHRAEIARDPVDYPNQTLIYLPKGQLLKWLGPGVTGINLRAALVGEESFPESRVAVSIPGSKTIGPQNSLIFGSSRKITREQFQKGEKGMIVDREKAQDLSEVSKPEKPIEGSETHETDSRSELREVPFQIPAIDLMQITWKLSAPTHPKLPGMPFFVALSFFGGIGRLNWKTDYRKYMERALRAHLSGQGSALQLEVERNALNDAAQDAFNFSVPSQSPGALAPVVIQFISRTLDIKSKNLLFERLQNLPVGSTLIEYTPQGEGSILAAEMRRFPHLRYVRKSYVEKLKLAVIKRELAQAQKTISRDGKLTPNAGFLINGLQDLESTDEGLEDLGLVFTLNDEMIEGFAPLIQESIRAAIFGRFIEYLKLDKEIRDLLIQRDINEGRLNTNRSAFSVEKLWIENRIQAHIEKQA